MFGQSGLKPNKVATQYLLARLQLADRRPAMRCRQ
jgi:hypothetical protein